MSNHESGQVWKPGQRELQHAGIVKLMHALGVPSYTKN